MMGYHDSDLVTPEELTVWRTHDWQPQAFHRLIATLDFFVAENERLRGDNEVKSEAIVNLLGNIDRLREEVKTNEKTWQVNQQHIKNLEDENARLREFADDQQALADERFHELARLRERGQTYDAGYEAGWEAARDRAEAELASLRDELTIMTEGAHALNAKVARLREAVVKVEKLAQSVIDKYDETEEAPYDIYVLRDILRNALKETT